ncbi:hypothetical protein F4553_002535 [Allocatelliglobosispora scoriae]|uniref:DUF3153 domain-containing protein n=1 Tax=Allocatelliglobosispora scoriae TaxID=643052 RepID=A0A841BPC3_9ACTN|nr:hypothetical protein [Allocatelliglobosispora scoriae]MBB5869156.1 hypothetical protein [Allocatelliglobosispora scoriae]
MHRRVRVTLVAIAMLAALAACGEDIDSSTEPSPGQANGGAFAKVDAETAGLVRKEAVWQAPKSVDVGTTQRIGLSVGEGKQLKAKIDNLIVGAKPTGAGEVLVGPTVRVSLHADPDDAEITPSEAVDASTGTDVQMLWTWLIKPKRPTKALMLTAWFDVPLSAGHTIHNEIALTLEVKRTLGYTVSQVATHWATWSGIVASVVTGAAWLWRRRRLLARGKPAADEPVSAVSAP